MRTWVALACICLVALISPPILSAGRKKPPAHPIDLNTATLEQLEELPGIGPVTAKRIIEFREKSGPFRKVEDLLSIPRISKGRLEKLRPYVKVTPPNADKKNQPPASES